MSKTIALTVLPLRLYANGMPFSDANDHMMRVEMQALNTVKTTSISKGICIE
jgi:hypothetical protein